MAVRMKDDHNVCKRRGKLADKGRGKLRVCWDVLGPQELKLHLLLLTSVGEVSVQLYCSCKKETSDLNPLKCHADIHNK